MVNNNNLHQAKKSMVANKVIFTFAVLHYPLLG